MVLLLTLGSINGQYGELVLPLNFSCYISKTLAVAFLVMILKVDLVSASLFQKVKASDYLNVLTQVFIIPSILLFPHLIKMIIWTK